MKEALLGLEVFKKGKGMFKVSAVSTLALLLLTFLLQNGRAAFGVFDFTYLPFASRLQSFLITLFDIHSTFTSLSLLVATMSAFLGGLSIAILYQYYTIRAKAFSASELTVTGTAYFIALTGIQCTACGTAVLGTILSLVGGVWLNQYLPLHGLEIGFIGIAIQIGVLYFLLRKLAYPLTC